MSRVEEYAEIPDYDINEVLKEMSEVNGKKQIKVNEDYIKYLNDPYFELTKSNRKIENAIINIKDLEKNIIEGNISGYDRDNYFENIQKDINLVQRFLDKGKQTEETYDKLNALLIQAETIVEIEKILKNNSYESTIDENKKESINRKINLNIFSNDLKKYYISKINALVTYEKSDEELAQNLEEEYINEFSNDVEIDLKDDFDDIESDLKDDFEEEKEELKQSKFTRFVSFSKKAFRKLTRGKLYTIAIELENLEKKLLGKEGKRVLSDELLKDYDMVEQLVNEKFYSPDIQPKYQKLIRERLKTINKKIEKIINLEKEEERLAQKEQIREKNKKNKQQFDAMMENVRKKPNRLNVNIVKEKIELNKDNKELFKNEEEVKNLLNEIDKLHENYVTKIIEKLDSKVKNITENPANINEIESLYNEIHSEDVMDILEELNTKDNYFEQVYTCFNNYIEMCITKINELDTKKAKEASILKLKQELMKHNNLVKNEEQLNKYLEQIDNIKVDNINIENEVVENKKVDNVNIENEVIENNESELVENDDLQKEDPRVNNTEEETINEILNDVELAMNTARNNPTKENIDNAVAEINKYKYNSKIFQKESLIKYTKADQYLEELDNLRRKTFSENIFGDEKKYEQYDNIINSKIASLDDLYEKLGEIEYSMHILEGQFIAPEQKKDKLHKLLIKKSQIESDIMKIKVQIKKYETLKEEKKLNSNYYDEFFKGISHLTDEQLAEGIKQDMSYEELAEISKNLEKLEKITPSAKEESITKETVSESAYENITNSISLALRTRLTDPEEAKRLIEKVNSIFNQNYFIYSEQQRENLNEYIQTATNMIDSELYKNNTEKTL